MIKVFYLQQEKRDSLVEIYSLDILGKYNQLEQYLTESLDNNDPGTPSEIHLKKSYSYVAEILQGKICPSKHLKL